ncbi:BTAD domain-containing putative transcriptional regulator [Actinosynnema sp. CS-041913]|uniref:AfsR/SARP family transcriptional regulator n=1 Tax=Actinosynnema sp. CS-041913 TaxID=3239917 RepID=UPI003D950229
MGAVRFQLLGEVRTSTADGFSPIRHARVRCVLAALLVDANRVVDVDVLADRVWGERLPQRPRDAVYSYVSRLRQALAGVPEARLGKRSGGYVLDVDPQAVDLHRFRALVACGGDDRDRAASLGSALDLVVGTPLTGVDSPWATSLREAVEREVFAARLDGHEVGLRLGRHVQAVTPLTALAAEHPLDERVARLVLIALAGSGLHAEALAHYEALRRRLADELGVDPSPELREIHRRMLADDRAPASAHPVPRQLPAAPRWFTGRLDELAALDELLGHPGTAVVSGSGGIGKSTLALRWAHRHADRFPGGLLFVNLRGFDPSGSPVPASSALLGFLDALGVERDAVPADLDGRTALFRSLTADRRVLVVLDNAADTEQVTPLLPGTGCVALVTSRHRLPALVTAHGALPVRLDALPAADARALLAERIGAARVSAEPAAADDLVGHCAGLPLALSVVAGRAQAHPTFPLAAFAAQLHDVTTRLNELDDDSAAGVRTVLSWSTEALDDEHARMFALLGTTPGPDCTAVSAACLADLPPARATAVLRALERMSLVQEHRAGRYRMYDLVRLYAAEQDIPQRDRDAAVRRVVDLHTHTAASATAVVWPFRRASPLGPVPPGRHTHVPRDLDAALTWFTEERAVLAATVRAAAELGLHNQVWQLARHLTPLYDRAGFLQDVVDAWQLAIPASRALGRDDLLADALLALGYANGQLGKLDDGLDHLNRALALARQTGDEMVEAIAENSLSILVGWTGDFAGAMRHAKRSHELLRRQGNDVFEAQSLSQVGWLAARLGDHETALDACRTAVEVFRAHGDRDSQAIATSALGYVARATGRLDDARALYQEACDLLRDVGNVRREAQVVEMLAEVLVEIGDHAAAHAAWERARSLFRAQHRVADVERVEARLGGLDTDQH